MDKLNRFKIGGGDKTQRQSNLELLRIIAMLAIIAHHYVVNSGVIELYDFNAPSYQQLFLEVWGMWGKTAINSFILISGYFLCKQSLTLNKWLKLFFQILFYKIVFTCLFAMSGYQPITLKILSNTIFSLLSNINGGFTASFMVFYAFVPFYNKLNNAMNEKEHKLLIIFLLIAFTISSTFFRSKSMNEPCWYMTLYFIASYIRLYPKKYFDNKKIWYCLLGSSILLSVVSVLGITWIGSTYYIEKTPKIIYYFVADSNKLFALIVGMSAFLVAKNAKPFYNRTINFFAAGTFGVLLIHANSDAMRRWLWQDVINVPSLINAPMCNLIIISIICPIIIFITCSLIDYLRRKYIEKPFMKWIDERI